MIIPPEIGKAGVRLTLFIFVLAVLVLVWTRPAPETAGFVITMFMLIVSGGTATILVILDRLGRRRSRYLQTPDGEANTS